MCLQRAQVTLVLKPGEVKIVCDPRFFNNQHTWCWDLIKRTNATFTACCCSEANFWTQLSAQLLISATFIASLHRSSSWGRSGGRFNSSYRLQAAAPNCNQSAIAKFTASPQLKPADHKDPKCSSSFKQTWQYMEQTDHYHLKLDSLWKNALGGVVWCNFPWITTQYRHTYSHWHVREDWSCFQYLKNGHWHSCETNYWMIHS